MAASPDQCLLQLDTGTSSFNSVEGFITGTSKLAGDDLSEVIPDREGVTALHFFSTNFLEAAERGDGLSHMDGQCNRTAPGSNGDVNPGTTVEKFVGSLGH